MRTSIVAAALALACATAPVTSAPGAAPASNAPPPETLTARAVVLPGTAGAVGLDYTAFDRVAGKLWIPAGDTGSVDVYDAASGAVTRIEGFPTVEKEMHGHTRKVGPSSAAVGDDAVFVGNRATSEVCAIDKATLKKGACAKLSSSPDGLQYVSGTKELWITTPHEKTLTVLDAALQPRATIPVPGSPEGYAIDAKRGLFYTNLENRNQTLQIDVATRQVKATWKADCGEQGPRGIAVDVERSFAFVACTDHVVVIDMAHDGAPMFRADTGAGVDNIDYLPEKRELFVASGKDAKLSVFTVDDRGALQLTATATTAEGARTVVADGQGNAYLINPKGGGILVVSAPH